MLNSDDKAHALPEVADGGDDRLIWAIAANILNKEL
jgi:hypothetical protein